MYMSNMKRTQIYLSRAQEFALNALMLATGKGQSMLIREAIDQFTARQQTGATS
jgi:predicted DNA-binding protein